MLKELVLSHYRYGYTRILLYIDTVFVLIILWDVYQYRHSGFALTPAVLSEPLIPQEMWKSIGIFFLFFVLVLPFLSALLKIVDAPGFRSAPLSMRPTSIMISHVFVCIMFIAAAYVLSQLQLISGWHEVATSDGPRFGTEFRSAFLGIVGFPLLFIILSTLVSVSTGFAGTLLGPVLFGKAPPGVIRQYAVKAALADLPNDLRPYTSSLLSPVYASAAPAVPATSEGMQRALRRYYSKSLTITEQVRFVDVQLEECRKVIRERLLEVTKITSSASKSDGTDIAFFSGPGRAFESAARAVGPVSTCILLPFGTSSLELLFERQSAVMGCKFTKLKLEPNLHFEPWIEQQAALLTQLQASNLSPGPILIVVSDVSFATGLQLPLCDLIPAIKAQLVNNEVKVIVDGSNSVGNRCLINTAAEWDAYVFAPYRWLMVTERCGVAVTKKGTRIGTADYGLFRAGERKRDEEVRSIASLASALQLTNERKLDYFWNRCEKLRKAFEDDIPRGFRIVGARSGLKSTFIAACAPAGLTEWKFSIQELDDRLASVNRYASMVTVDPARPWLRVTFPYHLDPRDINRLNVFLTEKST